MLLDFPVSVTAGRCCGAGWRGHRHPVVPPGRVRFRRPPSGLTSRCG
ncbi:hypothetical protein V2I01_02410 [Micromonospora sp. BRA006-A]|nr:hypothetical protein [Micromonospora sp. BRA006-A]